MRLRWLMLLIVGVASCRDAELPTAPTAPTAMHRAVSPATYDDGPARLVPQVITVSAGQTSTARVEFKFGSLAVPTYVSVGPPSVASGNATIPAYTASGQIIINAIAAGDAVVVVTIPNFGRAPGTYTVGRVTVTASTPPPPPRVDCIAPSMLATPRSQQILAGQRATITLEHSGTPPFTYSWSAQEPGGPLADLPNTTTNPTLTDRLYRTTVFWPRVSNSCGSAGAGAVAVTVTPVRMRTVSH